MSNVGIVHHSGSVLAMHVKSKQEKIKYPCEQCPYKATRKSNLAVHIKSIHKGEKCSCDQCPYQAAHKTILASHIKSAHQDSFLY